GVFNYQETVFAHPPNGPGGSNVTTRVKITDLTDGTSNTCMLSETKRSKVGTRGPCGYSVGGAAGDVYNLDNIYLIPATDPGWSDYTPMSGPTDTPSPSNPFFSGPWYHCNSWDYGPTNRITYRGCQYYRRLVEMSFY